MIYPISLSLANSISLIKSKVCRICFPKIKICDDWHQEQSYCPATMQATVACFTKCNLSYIMNTKELPYESCTFRRIKGCG